MEIPRYRALALQFRCDSVNNDNPAEARARMARSLERLDESIKVTAGFLKTFSGLAVRLVVVPEYFLTGFPLGESSDEWIAKAILEPNGAEYDKLGAIAERHSVYLSGNAYEADENFPGLYFQTSFIISPAGEVVLRYRRLISLHTPTPYDVLDRYVDLYGAESLFPVADTEIGRVACIASEEILYPEVARCLAMRGAEIFCHSSSESASTGLTPKDIGKRARASENMAYVVSANTAGIRGTGLPESGTDGMSKIVGPDGHVLDDTGFGESSVSANLDIGGLREMRQQPAMMNLLARQPFQLYHESYRDHVHLPANTLSEIPAGSSAREVARRRLAETVARLREEGLLLR